MQRDSSSTSRPGASAASGAGSTAGGTADSSAGAAGTGSARGTGSAGGASESGTSGGRTGGRTGGSGTYGGSHGGSAHDAYGDAGYDTESDSRLARRRARALDAANGDDRDRTVAFGAGVAVGALLGAGLALLLAPQAGKETRAVIARGARRIPERARDSWDELGEELRSALRRRTKGVRRGMRSARWKAADMMEG